MEKYIVDDIIPDNIADIKYLFVFESPHNTEVEKNIPISGKTGQYIARFLDIDANTSFGEFIKNREKKDTAIINIVNFPLQKINYDERNQKDLELFRFIRANFKSIYSHRNEEYNNFERKIVESFKLKTEKLLKFNINIILCGKFAEAYFTKAFSGAEYKQNPHQMPHPSRTGWQKLSNCQKNLLICIKRFYSNEEIQTY